MAYFALFMIAVIACVSIPLSLVYVRRFNDIAAASRKQLNEPRGERVVYIMGQPPQYAPQYALPAPPVPVDPHIDIDPARG